MSWQGSLGMAPLRGLVESSDQEMMKSRTSSWQSFGRRATVLAALCGIFVVGGGLAVAPRNVDSSSIFSSRPGSRVALDPGTIVPQPEPLEFKPGIDPATALQMNSAVPVANEPIPQPRPFLLDAVMNDAGARLNALDCLTAAVYYEAASESLTGKRAVAQVVINRVRHPAYPKSVCGVVFQGSERTTGCQFTFTCDGSLARLPSQTGWAAARRVAEQALAGHVETSVGTATHYHTVWVVPYWRTELTKLSTIGAHIFYRWSGPQGMPTAFFGRHSGFETQPVQLAQRLAGFLLGSLQETVGDANGLIVTDTLMEFERQPRLALKPSPLPPAGELVADAKETELLADQRKGTLLVK
jgi:hypothetical protein